MILGWFGTKDAKAFGNALATFYVERIPVEAQLNEKKFKAKTQEVLEKMGRQVTEYQAKHKVGVIAKAQIGNAFKWTLKDAGYKDEYIDGLTLWLVRAFR